MIDLLMMPAGCEVFIGAPVHPLGEKNESLIREALEGLTGISEAHIPQVFVQGLMEDARQVLVLVLSSDSDPDEILEQAGGRLNKILPKESYLDVLPIFETSEILATVREAGCEMAIL